MFESGNQGYQGHPAPEATIYRKLVPLPEHMTVTPLPSEWRESAWLTSCNKSLCASACAAAAEQALTQDKCSPRTQKFIIPRLTMLCEIMPKWNNYSFILNTCLNSTYIYACIFIGLSVSARKCIYIPWQPCQTDTFYILEMYIKYMYNTTEMVNKIPGSGRWVIQSSPLTEMALQNTIRMDKYGDIFHPTQTENPCLPGTT